MPIWFWVTFAAIWVGFGIWFGFMIGVTKKAQAVWRQTELCYQLSQEHTRWQAAAKTHVSAFDAGICMEYDHCYPMFTFERWYQESHGMSYLYEVGLCQNVVQYWERDEDLS